MLFIAHESIAHVFVYGSAKPQAFIALWCQLQNTVPVQNNSCHSIFIELSWNILESVLPVFAREFLRQGKSVSNSPDKDGFKSELKD